MPVPDNFFRTSTSLSLVIHALIVSALLPPLLSAPGFSRLLSGVMFAAASSDIHSMADACKLL
jgi:hypothetical protein